MLHHDSPLMQFAYRVTDLVVINLLLLLCSLPVVTGGASLAAAHGAVLDLISGDGEGPVRDFFRHFRANWRVATPGWLIVLAAGGLLIWEFGALGQVQGWGAFAAQTGVLAGGLMLAIWTLWFFPLTTRGLGFKEAGKLAALFGIGHLSKTAVALALLAAPVVVLNLNPRMWAGWTMFMTVIGMALVLWLADLMLRAPLLTVGEAPETTAEAEES